LRHFLILAEVLEDAASWVDRPWYNFNKGGKVVVYSVYLSIKKEFAHGHSKKIERLCVFFLAKRKEKSI
jgi:hypothetical protein